jgi:hypothetical protein
MIHHKSNYSSVTTTSTALVAIPGMSIHFSDYLTDPFKRFKDVEILLKAVVDTQHPLISGPILSCPNCINPTLGQAQIGRHPSHDHTLFCIAHDYPIPAAAPRRGLASYTSNVDTCRKFLGPGHLPAGMGDHWEVEVKYVLPSAGYYDVICGAWRTYQGAATLLGRSIQIKLDTAADKGSAFDQSSNGAAGVCICPDRILFNSGCQCGGA